MKSRSLLLRAGACLLLLFGDRLLATLAIETNAAGALLSPGGAVHLDAIAVAGLFITSRIALGFVFCGSIAWTASDAVSALFARLEGR